MSSYSTYKAGIQESNIGHLKNRVRELEAERDKLRTIIAVNCDPCAMTEEDAAVQQSCFRWWEMNDDSTV